MEKNINNKINMEKIINHIIESVKNGNQEKSKLNKDIFSLEGYSSTKIKCFLNNLLELKEFPINYLEIGIWKGSTFVSSLYENDVNSAYAIDNWSESNQDSKAKPVFFNTIKKFLPNRKLNIIENDCFTVDLSIIKDKINIYLYDGAHTYDAHYKSLAYYYDILDDVFLFIVDDYDTYPMWEQVAQATQQSIKDLNLKIIYDNHMRSMGRNSATSWWNGYYIAILQKQ